MRNPISEPKHLIQILCVLFLLTFSSSQIAGQEGIRLNTPDAYDGYILCTADNGGTYLLNNCGKIVNSWSSTFPSYHCRLTEEGNLMFISNNTIIERDWNDNTVVNINITEEGLRIVYEVIKLENGNYLAACRRFRDEQYFDSRGYSTFQSPNRTDGVVEVDPDGNIVWEWNIGDHTIQDKYANGSNYGVVSEHSELVNVRAISSFDWTFDESFMINGIDYNPELDQILLSVRKVSEIMIIDHSTTTQEAAGSTGGNSGKGGDILYRWGNPQNYYHGSESDRVLYYQHNPNWIKYGEHKGKIIMYNNGLDRFIPGVGKISSVHIIDPPMTDDGDYMFQLGKAYGPEEPDVTIDEVTTNNSFYSGYTSGAQVLPNGNIYITVGLPSDFIEVTADGEIVWEYNLAYTSYIFRTEQYAKDFPGFEGKDLTPGGTVEFPSSTYNCNLYTSTKDIPFSKIFSIHLDQVTNYLTLQILEPKNNVLEIRNQQGQLIRSYQNVKQRDQLSLIDLSTGIYFIVLHDLDTHRVITHEVFKF